MRASITVLRAQGLCITCERMTQVTEEPSSQRVWSNRSFRRLWFASTVSSFGSEVAELALPLLALLTLSASAAEVGLLRVAQFLPFLLATLAARSAGRPPAHGIASRSWWARTWVGSCSSRRSRSPCGSASPGSSCSTCVVFAAGILTVLYQIADFAFLPSVVDRHQLVDANGKIAASQSANEIGGRGLGGLLIQAISAPVAVAVNAVAFLVSALCLRRIKIHPADRGRGGRRGATTRTGVARGRRGSAGRGPRPLRPRRCSARRPRSTCSTRCSSSAC